MGLGFGIDITVNAELHTVVHLINQSPFQLWPPKVVASSNQMR